MVIAHNLTAMNAQRQFGLTRKAKTKSMEKLASGYRINRAADDAAGLAISEKMRRQIRGLNQGAANIQDGISMVQVADGALAEVNDMLNRMTELSVKAANGTLTNEDRQYIQSEVTALKNEIQRIADTTTFNEINIFNDPEYYDPKDKSITTLVSCKSADVGKLSEAYYHNGKYYSAAFINFDGINSSNINKLNGGNFTFNCSLGCSETFDITFTTDGTPSSCSNLSGKTHHYYSVDISGCTSGAEVVQRIYDYIDANPTNTPKDNTDYLNYGLRVSHTNNLIAEGNKLVIASTLSSFGTASGASQKFLTAIGKTAGVTCSTIEAEKHDDFRDFRIQCSSDVEDFESVIIWRMNTSVLRIDNINVSNKTGASSAISSIKTAASKIASQRSTLGAEQNRLEHALKTNQNTAENTSAAESAIRDTDMAKETVRNSMLEILEQAGVSMIVQANQQNQTVLSMLK